MGSSRRWPGWPCGRWCWGTRRSRGRGARPARVPRARSVPPSGVRLEPAQRVDRPVAGEPRRRDEPRLVAGQTPHPPPGTEPAGRAPIGSPFARSLGRPESLVGNPHYPPQVGRSPETVRSAPVARVRRTIAGQTDLLERRGAGVTCGRLGHEPDHHRRPCGQPVGLRYTTANAPEGKRVRSVIDSRRPSMTS